MVRRYTRTSLSTAAWLAITLASSVSLAQPTAGSGQPFGPPAPWGAWTSIMGSTAAIVEADVTDVSYLYDDQYGPRTLTTLTNLDCHRGTLPAYDKLTLSTWGGYTPEGTFLEVSHVPSFVVGSRVLVFLTNGPWFAAPVPWGWSFRIMEHRARKVVAGEGGAALIGLGSAGPDFGDPVTTFEELAAGARQVRSGAASVAERALDVDQLLRALDSIAMQRGLAISGELDLLPTLKNGARWNIVEPAEPDGLVCDEPLMSLVPKTTTNDLVCDGGGT